MKKLKIIPFVFPLFLMACSQQDVIPDTSSVSQEIEKIETSYVEGAYKYEGVTSSPKVVTLLSADLIQRSIDEITKKAEQEITNRKYSHSTSRQLLDPVMVGLVSSWDGCPTGIEKVVFFMDCEDTNPITKMVHTSPGNTNPYPSGTVVDGNKNFRMVICKVEAAYFARPLMTYNKATSQYENYTYAVLKFGTASIPSSTKLMIRNFDNEDKNNKNSSSGIIAPNVVNTNTSLQFHIIEGNASNVPDPSIGFEVPTNLGIFGGHFYALTFGPPIPDFDSTPDEFDVTIDDEDKKNANSCTVNGVKTTTPFPSFSATSDTRFKIVFNTYNVGGIIY